MTDAYPTLRIAFIGGHGHHLLRSVLEDPLLPVEAVAVASDGRDPQAAQKQFAPLMDQATWFDDPIAMFEAFQPTIVNIGGVFGHKTPAIVEALRRNIPAVVEKPVATSWEDMDAIRQAARRSEAVLLSEFPFRCKAAFFAAQAAVEAGEIGDVVLASAQKSYRFGDNRPDFYRRREDYGSTLLWVASHGIDAIRFITGQRFRTVAGAHGNLSRPDYESMEDHCAVLFTMENGATAVAHGDFLRPAAAATHGDDRLRIAGSRGVLEVRDERCRLVTDDQPERDITDQVSPEPIHRRLLDAAFRGETRWFSTEASLEMGAVLLAARDAADRGEIVSIAEPSAPS